MDLTPPSNQEVRWGDEKDEHVRIDQRGLIDKILARYSAQFPVLRELIQNADDANAEHVFIRFETKAFGKNNAVDGPRTPNLEAEVCRWSIHNDGNCFTPDDWDRLTTIASGNSDSQKIGAFGVGFYSVFSVTNEPSVKSGGQRMRFHWGGNKGKQLFAAKSIQKSCSASASSKWTTFELPVHSPAKLRGTPDEIGSFLKTSLPFMIHIKWVTVAFDSHILLRLEKSTGSITHIKPFMDLKPRHPVLMTVSGVNKTELCIRLKKPVYQNTPSPCDESLVHYQISEDRMVAWAAEIDVTLDNESQLVSGLEKAMKKAVPNQCKFRLIYTKENDYAKEGGARVDQKESYVHIGHTTAQTTGIAGHIEARFIPTVERELIDFENKDVKTWNEELLYVGGYLARTVYEYELSLVDDQSTKLAEALHTIRFFTFRNSTPNHCVSTHIKKAFFGCTSSSLPIVSSVGVRPACEVRSYDSLCASFVKKVPILTLEILSGAEAMVDDLKSDKANLKPISFSDLMQELTPDRNFSDKEMTSFLEWVIRHAPTPGPSQKDLWSAIHAARFKRDNKVIPLRNITSILDSPFIPLDMPLPEQTLPFEISHTISKQFSVEQLLQTFSWKRLSVIEWLENLLAPDELRPTFDEHLARRIFEVLARAWGSLEIEEKNKIRATLDPLLCIPTHRGLKRPKEVYITGSEFLADSPMADLGEMKCAWKPLRDVLLYLGANERIDLISLLKIAEERLDALQYFLDNYKYYEDAYNDDRNQKIFSTFEFIPVVDQHGATRMAKSSEAFIEQDCQTMGFWIIDRTFLPDAFKLKISNDPPPSKLISALRDNPPKTKDYATQCFEYLATQSSFFQEEEISYLSSMEFVPSPDPDEKPKSPSKCFIGKSSSNFLSNLFHFVDFGKHANSFLYVCGAKDKPTMDEIVDAFVQDPMECLRLTGVDSYVLELRRIAAYHQNIKNETLQKLKNAPILLGFRYEAYHRSKSYAADHQIQWSDCVQCPLSQVVIVDDARSYKLFKDEKQLFHAPKEFEAFYKFLGCKLLSQRIKEQYNPWNEITNLNYCQKVRHWVLERLKLFVDDLGDHEVSKRYHWMTEEGRFEVKVYKDLQVSKLLDFALAETPRRPSEMTAVYDTDEDGTYVHLLLTHGPLDYFDISCCICKIFFERPTSHLQIILMQLLSTKLDELTRRGYNVDQMDSTHRKDQIPKSPNPAVLRFLEQSKPNLPIQKKPSVNESSVFYRLRHLSLRRLDHGEEDVDLDKIDSSLRSAIRTAPETHDVPKNIIVRKDKAKQYCRSTNTLQGVRFVRMHGQYGIYEGECVKQLPLDACIDYFIDHVLKPLKEVFEYDIRAIRLLYDARCLHTIAFNDQGAVYLNLGYFEKEHFDKMKDNIPELLLSWYFTLAHEFTHHHVKTHDAAFEALFSRTCQLYALPLFRLPVLQKAINAEITAAASKTPRPLEVSEGTNDE